MDLGCGRADGSVPLTAAVSSVGLVLSLAFSPWRRRRPSAVPALWTGSRGRLRSLWPARPVFRAQPSSSHCRPEIRVIRCPELHFRPLGGRGPVAAVPAGGRVGPRRRPERVRWGWASPASSCPLHGRWSSLPMAARIRMLGASLWSLQSFLWSDYGMKAFWVEGCGFEFDGRCQALRDQEPGHWRGGDGRRSLMPPDVSNLKKCLCVG